MEKKRVIVTGGGASGLMAAIAAAENGAAVTILEGIVQPGKHHRSQPVRPQKRKGQGRAVPHH